VMEPIAIASISTNRQLNVLINYFSHIYKYVHCGSRILHISTNDRASNK
ncbi:MAG: hypothetical protein IM566_10420, partial [Pseudanabaena sp. M152S2SP2A07QC]|nr:hypothetical protein [Pseudanabaena sp. M152S2SP2A07QC]